MTWKSREAQEAAEEAAWLAYHIFLRATRQGAGVFPAEDFTAWVARTVGRVEVVAMLGSDEQYQMAETRDPEGLKLWIATGEHAAEGCDCPFHVYEAGKKL